MSSQINIVILRSVALAVELAGKAPLARTLEKLADRLEAGGNVDAHMAEVAKLLKERKANQADWDRVAAQIEAGSDSLQGESEGSSG